jgi:hypothetical protein
VGAGAIVALAGALCYAELATAYPNAGGDYYFLTRAFGRNTSFLYAWARSTVINSGSIALLAFVFGDYMSTVLSLGQASGSTMGRRHRRRADGCSTSPACARPRARRICCCSSKSADSLSSRPPPFLAPPVATMTPAPFSSTPALGMFGLAMVFVLLTYGGWNEAAYVSAEIEGGRRAIVGALVISLLIIAAAYLVANAALLYGLGLKGLADSKAAATDVMERTFGPAGRTALGLFVAVSALTSINATMIVGARTNYADRARLARVAVHGRVAHDARHAGGGLRRAGCHRSCAGRLRRAAARRLRSDGRVHGAGVLEFPAARRRRAVRPARARRRCRATFSRAALSADADRVLRVVRLARLFQHRLRREQEIGAHLAARDGGGRRRAAAGARTHDGRVATADD